MIEAHDIRHVGRGEFRVSGDPSVTLTTILGSCVSVCLWDSAARLGGMNHIVVPGGAGDDLNTATLGTNAMELLINALLKRGAQRDTMRGKVFGGARMIASCSDIGLRNCDFVRKFLSREAIPIVAESLGGHRGRRVQFWPSSGRARQMRIPTFAVRQPNPPGPQPQDDLVLF